MLKFLRRKHVVKGSEGDARPWESVLVRIGLVMLKQMEKIMIDLAKITADITAQRDVLKGVAIGVQNINALNVTQAKQIEDLKAALAAANVSDPATMAALAALDQTVLSNTALAAGLVPAVTANTSVSAADATAAATQATATP